MASPVIAVMRFLTALDRPTLTAELQQELQDHIVAYFAQQSPSVRRAGLVFGLNDVTKRCVRSELRAMLVLRDEVDPPLLVEHFPMIAFHYRVLLVPLSDGAGAKLKELFGLRRLSAIGIRRETPELDALMSFVCLKLNLHAHAASVPVVLQSNATASPKYLPLATFLK